ncbi:hypothetical protein DITRI_Ditri06bG0018900 [Diplodiscus trichospermus]
MKKDVEVLSDKMASAYDKPQIDLHEFLQQLGILKEEKHSEGADETTESLMGTDSSVKDYDELATFAENSFNWNAMTEMHGAKASFQVHDTQEELTFPTSIWNF